MGFLASFVLSSRARVWASKTQWVYARCQPYTQTTPLGQMIDAYGQQDDEATGLPFSLYQLDLHFCIHAVVKLSFKFKL